jgi:hypothetical protein
MKNEKEKRINKYYGHRNKILHGGRSDYKQHKERLELIEDLRSLVREALYASIGILHDFQGGSLPKTMAEVIDEHIHLKLRR